MKCRSCEADSLVSIIPLGKMPLANRLLKNLDNVAASEPRYNLEVMLCEECGLAQLKDIVDPNDLFSDYVYFSSHSDTMLQSAADLVQSLIPSIDNNALVIEIASNDGYLLKNYVEKGIPVLGIDPAANIAKVANESGIPTMCDFFGEAVATNLAREGKLADIIHANNVMAHVPDINGFIKSIKVLLKETGTAIIEVPYFLDLLDKLEFDTIYHEHVYYFSVKPLQDLFERHGLDLFDIEKLSIHGGSLRLFIGHQGVHEIQSIVYDFIQQEEGRDLFSPSIYAQFMAKIHSLKDDLVTTLKRLKSEGSNIAAYGASAKGTTLLNYFGIGKSLIDFVVDRSPAKQNHYTPGTHLSILHPDALQKNKSDYALLLSWNFAEEILKQQTSFRAQGGAFIIPLPEVKIAS